MNGASVTVGWGLAVALVVLVGIAVAVSLLARFGISRALRHGVGARGAPAGRGRHDHRGRRALLVADHRVRPRHATASPRSPRRAG